MYEISSVYWLIVTDLDGTLLDHHDYNFNSAKPILDKLAEHNIPLIINSSKTACEIEHLQQTLNSTHPFIAENGSGIIIPRQYFSTESFEANPWHDRLEITLGRSRASIINKLQQLPQHTKSLFQSFSSLTCGDIANLTGLSLPEAIMANDRLYTEPLHWLGTNTEKEEFFHLLESMNINFTEGGRFIHLMGQTNKGSAITQLAKLYQQEQQKPIKIVALGDSKNDIDMFKAADIPVVIRSPVHSPPNFEHSNKIISKAMGPEGWAEVIDKIFFKKSE